MAVRSPTAHPIVRSMHFARACVTRERTGSVSGRPIWPRMPLDWRRVTASSATHWRLFSTSIDSFHRAGNIVFLAATLASLAVFFDRSGRAEVAAVVYGASTRQASIGLVPTLGLAIAHLRSVLGEARFEELVAEGSAQETAEAVRFAQLQIERIVQRRRGVTVRCMLADSSAGSAAAQTSVAATTRVMSRAGGRCGTGVVMAGGADVGCRRATEGVGIIVRRCAQEPDICVGSTWRSPARSSATGRTASRSRSGRIAKAARPRSGCSVSCATSRWRCSGRVLATLADKYPKKLVMIGADRGAGRPRVSVRSS